MPPTFLQRNKKKSLLALLLLFLRERKILVLLLLVLLLASTVFLGPSSFLTAFPGGARFAAGIAWIAGKMGIDMSRWGLGGPSGRDDSYAELLAAFRAAKAGNGAAGWGAFFGHGGAGGAGDGTIPNSLDMVRGKASDLAGNGAGGANGGKDGAGADGQGGIRGVIDPADANANKDANGVALSDSDLGGEREGLVKSAFAGGFMNGFLGGGSGGSGGDGGLAGLNGLGAGGRGGLNGSGAGGDGGLSGGAFAGKGFFSGNGGAVGATASDLAKIGLNGYTAGKAPSPRVGAPAKGSLSSVRSHAVETHGMQGVAAAGLGGNQAFFQLAEGNGRAMLATTPNCAPPACPGEFSATNTGAIYDGNNIGSTVNNTILTVPTIDGPTPPNIPDTSIATDYENQAQQMEDDAQKCQAADKQYAPQADSLNAQLTDLSNQFKAADCGGGGCSKSKVNHCKALGNQMTSVCNQYMQVNCQRVHACPLTANQACQTECSDNQNQNAHSTTITNSDGTKATSVVP